MSNKKTLQFDTVMQSAINKRGWVFSLLIIGALLAFELFNYSTTDFALNDLLGNLRFAGIRWSTILALAFCGIDFAGIARIFTPEQGSDEPMEIWYLFGAWLLAATMNALLTWWGISIAIVHHESLGSSVVARETLIKVVPIFVATMVWLSRVLIIGTFSTAGEHLFSFDEKSVKPRERTNNNTYSRSSRTPTRSKSTSSSYASARRPVSTSPSYAKSYRPAPKSRQINHPEPTYEPTYENGYQQPSAMTAKSSNSGPNRRYN